MKYTIRQMQAHEIPLIVGIDRSEELSEEYVCTPVVEGIGLGLVRKAIQPARQIPNWGHRELESQFALYRRNLQYGAILLGGFNGEILVGFVLVTVHPDENTGEIYSLFVDRSHRGNGLGSALVKQAEAYCRSRGSPTLILYTGHSAPAVDFYLKRGFRIVGIRDPRFATKGFDLTVAKDLRNEQHAWADAEDGTAEG